MHCSALPDIQYLWNTVSRYDTQSVYQYIAVSICIADPYQPIDMTFFIGKFPSGGSTFKPVFL